MRRAPQLGQKPRRLQLKLMLLMGAVGATVATPTLADNLAMREEQSTIYLAGNGRVSRSRPASNRKEPIMYAVIRTYSGKGAKELFDVLEKRKKEVENLIRPVKGFVS